MKAIFTDLIFTFNSLSLMIVVFVAKNIYTNENLDIKNILLLSIPVISIVVATLLVRWSFRLIEKRSNDEIKNELTHVESADNIFLPTYLGYFFVSLSIESYVTFLFVFTTLFVFTYVSRNFYFNPIFLLFNFKFYYVVTADKSIQKFIITKKDISATSDLEFRELKRINNFTFIDMEKRNE